MRILLFFLITIVFISKVWAKQSQQDMINNSYAFAEKAISGVILHELGHYVVRNFDIQPFNFEEDIADSFVVYSFLVTPERFKSQKDYKIASNDKHSILIHFADYFYYSNLLGLGNKRETTLHSTAKKRFFNLVCLFKDGNKDFFNDYIQKRQLNDLLKNQCSTRYYNLVKSWNFYLADKWKVGGIDYEIKYKESDVRIDKIISNYLNRKNGWIEWTMSKFPVMTEDKIIVSFENCNGDVNAYYLNKSKTIKICYEYVNSLVKLKMRILKLKNSL